MTPFQTSVSEGFFLPVPENFHSANIDAEFMVIWLKGEAGRVVILPPGSYRILNRVNECTEEEAGEVVDFSEMAHYGLDNHKGGYLCYERGYWYYKTATESLLALARSVGAGERDLIVLKIKE